MMQLKAVQYSNTYINTAVPISTSFKNTWYEQKVTCPSRGLAFIETLLFTKH